MTATARQPVIAVAWFRREDYDRIREICDDEMIPNFGEWEAKMTDMIASLKARGIRGEKMVVDPDDLLAFAKARGVTSIDTKVRGAFAATLFNKKQSH